MQVYLIHFLTDTYKSLLQKKYKKGLLPLFNAQQLETWVEVSASIDNKKGLTPDIFNFESIYLVLPNNLLKDTTKFFGDKFEMLPISWDNNSSGHIINVYETTTCFDFENAEFIGDEEFILEIEKYSFINKKLPDTGLFRLPEDPACLFYVEAGKEQDSFVTYVKEADLKGIELIPVWKS